MTLNAVVERYAQLEKRGVLFYRGLAERFPEHPVAARVWRELSNTEASHFALLELAQDWIAMAGGGENPPPVTEAGLDTQSARMAEIEAASARPGGGIDEAVELTIRWEEAELPRILELVTHLPARARGQVMAGMIAEAPEHYRVLLDLVKASGGPGQAERVAALVDSCRAALG